MVAAVEAVAEGAAAEVEVVEAAVAGRRPCLYAGRRAWQQSDPGHCRGAVCRDCRGDLSRC